AHRIDVRVARGDGDLAAGAGLAGARDDPHDPLVNLRDFALEELLDELRIAAAQDDLRPARLAVDVLDPSDDAVARAIRLARRLLAHGEDALGPSEVDDDVVPLLETADDALDQLPLAILELVENQIAFFVTNALNQYLFRGLRGD